MIKGKNITSRAMILVLCIINTFTAVWTNTINHLETRNLTPIMIAHALETQSLSHVIAKATIRYSKNFKILNIVLIEMDFEQLVNTTLMKTMNVESQNANVSLKKYKDVSHQMKPARNVMRTGITVMSAMNVKKLTATKSLLILKQYAPY